VRFYVFYVRVCCTCMYECVWRLYVLCLCVFCMCIFCVWCVCGAPLNVLVCSFFLCVCSVYGSCFVCVFFGLCFCNCVSVLLLNMWCLCVSVCVWFVWIVCFSFLCFV